MLATLGRYGGGVDFQLVGVERYGFGGPLDVDVDIALALVGPGVFWQEVEERDGVVGWFDARPG